MKRKPRLSASHLHQLFLFGLIGTLPALMGGCPEFRNSLVNIANDTTQGVILGGEDQATAWDTAVRGALSATIDLLFDQLRDDGVR